MNYPEYIFCIQLNLKENVKKENESKIKSLKTDLLNEKNRNDRLKKANAAKPSVDVNRIIEEKIRKIKKCPREEICVLKGKSHDDKEYVNHGAQTSEGRMNIISKTDIKTNDVNGIWNAKLLHVFFHCFLLLTRIFQGIQIYLRNIFNDPL